MKMPFKNRILILGIILFILFILVAVMVFSGTTQQLDDAIIKAIYKLRGGHSQQSGVFYWINRLLTELGYIYILIPACVLAVIIGRFKVKSLILGLGTGIVWAINHGTKKMFVRARPDSIYHMMVETSASFPSGHTMTSAFFYWVLAFIISKSKINKKLRSALSITSAVMPFLIGITRINLCVHYLTDVLAGLLLGGFFACIAIALLNNLYQKDF